MNAIPDRTEELKQLLAKYGKQQATPTQSDFRSDDAVCERARKYVEKMDAAVSGEGGHNKTYAVACVLVKGFELSTAQALDILKDYNARCDPPWTEHELQHKIDDASRASGASGYLRNAKPERWESINVPQHKPPKQSAQPAKAEERRLKRSTLQKAVEAAIEHAQLGKKKLIDTGIRELNHAIGGGFEFGEMVLIAARPSHGKSALGLQFISAMTAAGIDCAFMSEEMKEQLLGKRVLQFGQSLPESQWAGNAEQLRESMNKYFGNRAECHVIENSRTVHAVCEEIRDLATNHGVKAVVVDYVQLLGSVKGSRYEIVTASSVALRQVCTETGVLLITLAQMSRSIEGRESFMPRTSDLKESGQLEQDADVIMFLVWPWMLDKQQDKEEYHIYINKNRNREIRRFMVNCSFDPERQKVTAKQEYAEYDNA